MTATKIDQDADVEVDVENKHAAQLPSKQNLGVSAESCSGSENADFVPTDVPFPMGIQYALAAAFIVASWLARLFATTVLGKCIWSCSNVVFAKLASISDATPQEIERSRREARTSLVCERVKVVTTRRYVHGMRYWQEMAMTVVQLAEHTIFYNPLPIPVEEMRALAADRQVVLVVPNLYHHMFVDDYVAEFPSAVLVGSQEASHRHNPCLRIVLPSAAALPPEVEVLRVEGWALDEFVLVMHPARLFSSAHFISCGHELSVGGARLLPAWLRRVVCQVTQHAPGGGLPLYERLTVSDGPAAAAFVAKLQALDLELAVSAHGGLCSDSAQEVLERGWGWLASRATPRAEKVAASSV